MSGVKLQAPICECVSVFMGECRMNQCEGEKLTTPVEIVELLTGTFHDFRQEFHVFASGLVISWIEEREVSQEM